MNVRFRTMLFSLLLIVTSVTEAANTFDVQLSWTSPTQSTDLDLYIKNSRGQIVDYSQRTSDWGATHVRDDQGQPFQRSYESFSVDLEKMDCLGGTYTFYISHYSGPSVSSTVSVTKAGATIGSWAFTTAAGQVQSVISYTGQPAQCPANQLSSPTIDHVTVGGEVVAVISFPTNSYTGVFSTTITLPPGSYIKSISLLRTAAEIYAEKITMITDKAKSDVVMLALSSIPISDLVGKYLPDVTRRLPGLNLLGLGYGAYRIGMATLQEIAEANTELERTQKTNVIFAAQRNVKYIIWYQKPPQGTGLLNAVTVAGF